MTNYSFLLIGAATDSMWPLILDQALAPLGKLRLASQSEALQIVNEYNYDIVIIDAGVVSDPVELISNLQSKQVRSRIIVATSSPTWQRARKVLQAGATDYIFKSLDKSQLRLSIQKVLASSLRPSNPGN